ncbi:MAG: quinoprotein dehydrogenase-associated putative ABC transporter substrate-binding protein [Gemmatimonadales bacterium]|nr:quinoprotein dehydrogenase-associated putative ABC transporter substrate-binding protein [Gemmatimonadales bacterium]
MLRSLVFAGLLGGLAASPAVAQRPGPLQPGVLRVCADPDNMPFSNQKGEGFENKIAEFIASEWKSKLEYVWYPVRRGYFRILNGRYCDLIVQAPGGLDMAGTTDAYYRSGYVFVTRTDGKLKDITSLADPRLKQARIGVTLLPSDEQLPPTMALSHYGVVGNLRGFQGMYNDDDRPEDVIEAVANDEVDVAIVWGPLAGYFAKQSSVPLRIHPLGERDSLADVPFRYDIAMAVRRADRELQDSLKKTLEQKAPQIQAILRDYGVPTFPIEKSGGVKADSARATRPS